MSKIQDLDFVTLKSQETFDIIFGKNGPSGGLDWAWFYDLADGDRAEQAKMAATLSVTELIDMGRQKEARLKKEKELPLKNSKHNLRIVDDDGW